MAAGAVAAGVAMRSAGGMGRQLMWWPAQAIAAKTIPAPAVTMTAANC